ncbi:MAG TPA: YetF domain-containing protein [Salegentibacter sp.]|uniref:DUF421 domain-containing protein n=1 Tax=Salegentibacter sp. TaxID=1903072 RepID=UPI002F9324E7
MEEILIFFDSIFGVEADKLKTIHVLSRTAVIYIVGIALVRIGNKRFVGKMTAFDFILAIIIGSLLSRAITRSDLFLNLILASLLLILIHWFFSILSVKFTRFGDLIKGTEKIIVKNGEIKWEALKSSNLSEQDLIQSLRLNTNSGDITKVKIARLERNGEISFIFKNTPNNP